MVALSLAPTVVDDPQPALIAMVRLAALECRAAPRVGLSVADAMRVAAVEDMVTLLARALPKLLNRRPAIRRPGSAGRSFDEDWLCALARALRSDDSASAHFLLARRARPEGAAVLRMLVGDIAARLDDG